MERKAIVADDDMDNRDNYALFIDMYTPDVKVEQVSNGADLVDRVLNGNYALVLTDDEMPPGKVNGLEAIRQIREKDKATPIYMISGSDVEEEAMKLGATGYINKDNLITDRTSLVTAITKNLGN